MAETTLRGVNLGGWLVLERWITPSLFADVAAIDEYGFSQTARHDETLAGRLQQHRKTFVTEADFAWLAGQGLNAVRIPVGYWLFGAAAPYYAADDYLDQAFTWAKCHKLQVLISLHGAPGSQNGRDHSGRQGKIGWPAEAANIAASLEFIQRFVSRYGQMESFWGIELLNEPSVKISRRTLTAYYEQSYQIIRRLSPQLAVVISDGFRPRRWRHVLTAGHERCFIDTHQYRAHHWLHRRQRVGHHTKMFEARLPAKLQRMERSHKVIVGEWSAALDKQSLRGLDARQRVQAVQAYAAAQLQAYERTAGWFYWTYKTEDNGPWNFRASLEAGLLPSDFDQR